MASRSFLSQATSSSSAASAASTSTSATPRRLPRPLSSSSDLLTDDDTALVEHDQLQDEHLMLRERSAEDHYHTNVSTASSFCKTSAGIVVLQSPLNYLESLLFRCCSRISLCTFSLFRRSHGPFESSAQHCEIGFLRIDRQPVKSLPTDHSYQVNDPTFCPCQHSTKGVFMNDLFPISDRQLTFQTR